MTDYADQLGFGGVSTVAAHSVAAKAHYIMETYPEARENDNLMVWLYWLEFSRLGDLLRQLALCDTAQEIDTKMRAWLLQAPSVETIRRRRCEWNEKGQLLPPTEVVADRRKKSKLGASRFHRG